MTTVARLRALVTVADAGSVRQAARRLTVTESAVSSALSALAREVRVPLVERDGRGLRLTASGQAYSGYARAILGLHEEGLAATRTRPRSLLSSPAIRPSTSGSRWAAASGCGACSARTRPTW
jgi:DNA-binding transcriptional LysR family regulator